MTLAAVGEAALAAATAEAEALRAAAQARAEQLLAAAHAEAAARLAQRRALAERLADAEEREQLARARAEARAVVLRAQESVLIEATEAAHRAARRLRGDPRYEVVERRLAAEARDRLSLWGQVGSSRALKVASWLARAADRSTTRSTPRSTAAWRRWPARWKRSGVSDTADSAVITRVNGPVVEVGGGEGLAMLDLVLVGPRRLPGEVISLSGDTATVQVYEYTGGLKPGDQVLDTGGPLTVELGPGLLGGVFDGVLRRLAGAGVRVEPGAAMDSLPDRRRWMFRPSAGPGQTLSAGQVLGGVTETRPSSTSCSCRRTPGASSTGSPSRRIRRRRADRRVGDDEVRLSHRWPVRRPRPVQARLPAANP